MSKIVKIEEPEIPEAPEHLSNEAERLWCSILDEWDIEGTDLVVLQTALEALDRIQECRKIIELDGSMIVDPSGRIRVHPALTVEKDSRIALLRAWRQLGFEDEKDKRPVGRPPGSFQ